MSTGHRTVKCLNCGDPLNVVASVWAKTPPKPLDIVVCSICRYVMVLDDQLELRHPTRLEKRMFAVHPYLKEALKRVHLN